MTSTNGELKQRISRPYGGKWNQVYSSTDSPTLIPYDYKFDFAGGYRLFAELDMPRWVSNMPKQSVEVVPFEEHEEGKGMAGYVNKPLSS